MAKRFIETGLLRKPLLRGLQGAYKGLFVYYITECDHAGIWNKSDLDIAGLILGESFTEEDIQANFGDILIDLGDKWFMPSFITFQYPALNPENRAHNSVIKLLEKHSICPDLLVLVDENNKPLARPLLGCKVKVKGKVPVKSKVKVKKDLTKEIAILNDLFGRRETTKWSAKEIKALHQIDFHVDDIELIQKYYDGETGSEWRRRDIQTLLNNWQGEVDRAKLWYNNQTQELDLGGRVTKGEINI